MVAPIWESIIWRNCEQFAESFGEITIYYIDFRKVIKSCRNILSQINNFIGFSYCQEICSDFGINSKTNNIAANTILSVTFVP